MRSETVKNMFFLLKADNTYFFRKKLGTRIKVINTALSVYHKMLQIMCFMAVARIREGVEEFALQR